MNYQKKPWWNSKVVDLRKPVPVGMHEGKNLLQIMKDDPGYYQWMIKNDLITQWDLLKPRKKL